MKSQISVIIFQQVVHVFRLIQEIINNMAVIQNSLWAILICSCKYSVYLHLSLFQ